MLADKVKAVAKSKNITLTELEKDCNLPQGYLSKWNTNAPSYDKVVKVAVRLGVTVEDLVGDT